MQKYGSKTKLRPYGSKPAAQPDPLTTLRENIERMLAEHAKLIAEELRLFTIVDKYDHNGKRGSNEAYDARAEWDKIWQKINRHDSVMHNMMARERRLRNE
jgi:hypothetical protein